MQHNIILAFDFGRKTTVAGVTGKDWEFVVESGYERKDIPFGDDEEMYSSDGYLRFTGRGEVEKYPLESKRMLHCAEYCVVNYMDSIGASDRDECNVVIGSDVPLMQFGNEKIGYIEYFTKSGTRTVMFKGKEYTIRFTNAIALPQGIAAYGAYAGNFRQYDQLLILDIGSRTKLKALVDKTSGKIQYKSYLQLNDGVITLFEQIRDRLEADRISIPESAIEAAINGTRPEHRRADLIMQVVESLTDAYVEHTINQLYEAGVDTDMPILLVGGGSELLYSRLKDKMYVVGHVGVYANMRGIRKAMELKYGKTA